MAQISDSQIKVNRKGLVAIIEYDRWMTEFDSKMEEVGVSINHGPGSPWIMDALLDLLGFPENSFNEETQEGFCRDYLTMPCDDDGLMENQTPEEYLDWLILQKKELSKFDN